MSRQEPKLRGLGLPEEKKDARNRGSRPAGQALSTSREAMAEKAWGGGATCPLRNTELAREVAQMSQEGI